MSDSHVTSRTTPSCFSVCNKEKPVLTHCIVMYIGPSNPKCSRLTDDGEPRQPEVIKPPKFSELLNALRSKVSADWEDIGLALDLESGQLSAIKSDHQECKKCFREMLKLWLKQVDPPPTWSAIIDAIEICEYESLAEELRKKYCN